MYTKFAKFARLYISYSLQHFTTKLRNFSKRGMLFQAMVIFLRISIFFKIFSERGKVHFGSVQTSHQTSPRFSDIENPRACVFNQYPPI